VKDEGGWEQGRHLIGRLADDVISGMTPQGRSAIGGQTVIVVGNRDEVPLGVLQVLDVGREPRSVREDLMDGRTARSLAKWLFRQPGKKAVVFDEARRNSRRVLCRP
jgi:hypothetical protein